MQLELSWVKGLAMPATSERIWQTEPNSVAVELDCDLAVTTEAPALTGNIRPHFQDAVPAYERLAEESRRENGRSIPQRFRSPAGRSDSNAINLTDGVLTVKFRNGKMIIGRIPHHDNEPQQPSIPG